MTKPTCADFIVTTIRAIRLDRQNLKDGTGAGVAMHRLSRVVTEEYSRREFCEALNQLLADETVVATWDTFRVTVSREGGKFQDTYGKARRERVDSIPPEMPLHDKGWHRRLRKGTFLIRRKQHSVSHDWIGHFLFYVAADGLAKRASRRHPN